MAGVTTIRSQEFSLSKPSKISFSNCQNFLKFLTFGKFGFEKDFKCNFMKKYKIPIFVGRKRTYFPKKKPFLF
jgi:hypothetical protein